MKETPGCPITILAIPEVVATDDDSVWEVKVEEHVNEDEDHQGLKKLNLLREAHFLEMEKSSPTSTSRMTGLLSPRTGRMQPSASPRTVHRHGQGGGGTACLGEVTSHFFFD